MTTAVYIDGKDAYNEYGVFITKEGYASIIGFPPMKKIAANDWPEEDGIEADLSAPVLGTKEFPIKFARKGNMWDERFFDLLSDGAYHTFDFNGIGRSYKLRLLSEPNLYAMRGMEIFTLQFADDFPFSDNYTYRAPQSSIVPETGYELDGTDFSVYGIHILEGSETEIARSPAVKKNLTQEFKNSGGSVYDGKKVCYQTKEVRLNCLMRAETTTEFWNNYDALLYNLSKPGEHILYSAVSGSEYPCYYKSCSVSAFFPFGKIWFRFGLTLVFTSFRKGGNEWLLSTEDDHFIITEDEKYHINIGQNG